MSKIRVRSASLEAVNSVRICDMAEGYAVVGTLCQFQGLFLRTYDGLVFLDDLRYTWDAKSAGRITNFKEVDLEIIATPVVP